MYNPTIRKWPMANPERPHSNFFICQVVFNVVAVIIIICLIVAVYRDRHNHMNNDPFWSPMHEKMEECVHRYRCEDFGEMVCGSDGLIYDNECKLKVTACQFPEMKLGLGSKRLCAGLKSVTLVGGKTPNEGNVYARNPDTGIFGPVCDDAWDVMGAYVVCKELNYQGVLRYSLESYFGSVTPMFSYDDVKCVGYEDKMEHCRHLNIGDCGPNEAAGVVCDDGTGSGPTWAPSQGPNSTQATTWSTSVPTVSSSNATTAYANGTSTTSAPGNNTTTPYTNGTSTTTAHGNTTTPQAPTMNVSSTASVTSTPTTSTTTSTSTLKTTSTTTTTTTAKANTTITTTTTATTAKVTTTVAG